MLVNCEEPDLLLCYVPGAAGRLLIHLVMLSPEVHTWSTKTEEELETLPVCQHAQHKLAYIKECVFPLSLKENIASWKSFEPQPWDSTYIKTKKFIRHSWMIPSFEKARKFNCKKIAFVDYTDNLYFLLRAVVKKNSFGLFSPNTSLPPDNWYKADTKESSQELIVKELHAISKVLKEWKKQGTVHPIVLESFISADVVTFSEQYLKLCHYYEVTPCLSEATSLWSHWLNLHGGMDPTQCDSILHTAYHLYLAGSQPE